MPETMRLMNFTDNTDAACESEAVSELCLLVSVLFNLRCSHTTHFFSQSKLTSLTGAFVGARLRSVWRFNDFVENHARVCLRKRSWIRPLFVTSAVHGALSMILLVCKQKEKFKKYQEFTHESNHRIGTRTNRFCRQGSVGRAVLIAVFWHCPEVRALACDERSLWQRCFKIFETTGMNIQCRCLAFCVCFWFRKPMSLCCWFRCFLSVLHRCSWGVYSTLKVIPLIKCGHQALI